MNNVDIKFSIDRSRFGSVLVEHKGHRRVLYANPMEFPFVKGDTVIVEADRGIDQGVVKFISLKSLNIKYQTEYNVIRKADLSDLELISELSEREIKALGIIRQKVEYHKLPMKVVDSEYRFDSSKLYFYFASEQRIDFRELVKELATIFKTRIELRQIGARDEVKRFDGYGVCGQRLCCVTHLNSFQPVTTAMAKNQGLLLNPSKLSGPCGRLKCCLNFENEMYLSGSISYNKSYLIEANLEELDKLSD